MVQITTRISIRERDYVDTLINQGKFASYGHCFRGLLHWHKVLSRENSRLRTENVKLREYVRLIADGKLQATAAIEALGIAPYAKEA